MNNTHMRIANPLSDQYKAHTRQLSLGKLFSLLNIEPTPMQEDMVELWDNRIEDWNEVNVAASRRQGKTFTAAVIAIRELLVINSSTMVVSKSAKSVSVLFNEILRMLRVLGLKPTKVNSNQYSLQLNDSILRCTVHKTIETLLGNKASLIILDECGTYAYSEDVNINLLPMRSDFGTYEDTNKFVSKVLRISSPRSIGSDFYYDYIKGLEGRPKFEDKTKIYISDKGVCSLTFSIYDSPLASPELIESIKASCDEDTWKTEYLAQFVHLNTISAFSQFNKDRNTFKPKELIEVLARNSLESLGFTSSAFSNSSYAGFMGLDVGFRDSSAIIVGTVIEDKIYILDAYAAPYLTTKEFAEKIKDMHRKWETNKPYLNFRNDGAIYIDKSAALTANDLTTIYDIPVIPGFNKVRDGISMMNTAFKNNKLFINEELVELIDEVETLAFKETVVGALNKNVGDPFVRIKGSGHHDRVHAMRYLVTSLMQYWGVALSSPIEGDDEIENVDE